MTTTTETQIAQTKWLKLQDPDPFEFKHLTGMFSAFEAKCAPESLQEITRTKRLSIAYADQIWRASVKAEDWDLHDTGKYDTLVVKLCNGVFLYSPNTDFKMLNNKGELGHLDVTTEPAASSFSPIFEYGARYLQIKREQMDVMCIYSFATRGIDLIMGAPTSDKLICVRFRQQSIFSI